MHYEFITPQEFAPVLARLDKLEKDNAILRRLVIENGDMVSTEDAMRMTGIKDLRTLKKRISGWVQKGTGPITWPKTTIIEYISSNAIAA